MGPEVKGQDVAGLSDGRSREPALGEGGTISEDCPILFADRVRM